MCMQNDTKIRDRFSFENRIPIDPDQVFDRDRDRECNFKIGIRFENENRGSIMRSKSLIDFHMKIGSRFIVPSVQQALKSFFNRGSI